MPRREMGKGRAGGAPKSSSDQVPGDNVEAGPSTASPAGTLPKSRDPQMAPESSSAPVTPAAQVKGADTVSATVVNISSHTGSRPTVASKNPFDLLGRMVEDWAAEVADEAGTQARVIKSEFKDKGISAPNAPASVTPGTQMTQPQSVALTAVEVRQLRKTPKVLLVGERGRFTWHVAQGLLKRIARHYQEDPSSPFPSGMNLEFPQTTRSILQYVGTFITNGGFDSLLPGATAYPSLDLRALVRLESVVIELGITELEVRSSRDIQHAQRQMSLQSTTRAITAPKRVGGGPPNPELFCIMAEYKNKLYKVHCRENELALKSRKTTKGTLHCVGVIRHFVDYKLPSGPLDIVGRDDDGLWTVTCSVAMLQVDFVSRRSQTIAGHLDLLHVAA